MAIDADAEILHGTQIGRFVVTGELGRGGMGAVYAARDRELDRQVALKVLRAQEATEEERTRMMREGQAMARIVHPNVITVYEVGVEGSLVFLAQELLDAGTLAEWLDKPRGVEAIVDKFAAAGKGLAAAHAAGLVHRDFKPANVLLGTDGRVRVADFGLARALDVAEEGLPASTRANIARAQLELSRNPMSPLTRTGAVMGTPMFMAPEQHLGERADERSDQFSFCVALYHALYDAYPFAGKTAVALADAVIEGRLQKPPRGRGVPGRLRRVVLRGLSNRRDDRYPSMEALLADLTRPPRRLARRLALAVGALALVGGAVVAGYLVRDREAPPPVQEPLPELDIKTVATDRSAAWLVDALERGLLDDVVDKYGMAAALGEQRKQPAHVAIAKAAAAVALVERGKLGEARARLREATASAGRDTTALGYVDLAAAEVALASGDLEQATVRSAVCAKRLSRSLPDLAALCFERHGDAVAAHGDPSGARQAYNDGIAVDKRTSGHHRALSLQLALARLEIDGKPSAAASRALSVQGQAADRGAAAAEARAWIVLAHAHLAEAESQRALEDLEHVKPAGFESFAIRIEHQIISGQTYALLGDPDEGFKRLDAARAEAERLGFAGMVLRARLARVEAMVVLSLPDAAEARTALVEDARKHDYRQIVHLAETILDR